MQRGFNLVEMSIIMVVTGLVLGAVLIPSHALLEEDIYKEEERQLQRIKTSILGYAVRHRTDGKGLRVDGGAPPHVYRGNANIGLRAYTLPGGRPYLPCPDITGDGYEDRTYYDRAGFAFTPPPPAGINAAGPADKIRHNIRLNIELPGSCFSPRGVLPWRTLGVPPADHWGNIYTYQVDGVIADSLTGFNQNSYLDVYDQRFSIQNNSGKYQLRTGSERGRNDRPNRVLQATLGITLNGIVSTVAASSPPVVVCGGAVVTCGISVNMLTLVAGAQTAEDLSNPFFYRPFEAGDIISGLPFVVLSHGANGGGAVNYNRHLKRVQANRVTIADGLVCNFAAPENVAEALNFPQLTGILPATICSDVSDGYGFYGFMFYQPRTENFDDVMLWATFDEVLEVMHEGGVLPAADWPIFINY